MAVFNLKKEESPASSCLSAVNRLRGQNSSQSGSRSTQEAETVL